MDKFLLVLNKRKLKVFVTLFALSSVTSFSFMNCSQMSFKPIESQQLSSQATPTGSPQCSFNGVNYSENDHVTAFQNSNVAAGEKCVSEDRVCHNGSFSGSFQFPSCKPLDPASCLFNGKAVNNGESITAFQNSSVAFGESCKGETRLCTNGVLSGSFNFSACSVDSPKSCLFNGVTYAHGTSVVAYVNSAVPFGQTCQSETRMCNNGVLSGSAAYAACAVGQPQMCLFNGNTIASGQSVTAYANSSVPYGQTCVPESRTCNNGSLSGSAAYSTCSVMAAKSCIFNGQNIASGQQTTAYQNSSVPFGQTCQSQTRICSDGVLSGTYSFASCSVNQPSSCLFNGVTVANGQAVTAYSTSTVPYGQSCVQQSRSCSNGTLSGSYSYASCSVNQPSSCLFNGTTVAHGQSVIAFATSSVPYGQSCSSQQLTRTCSNGVLSGSNAYTYGSCSVDQPSSCLFNGMTIANGQSVTAYTSSSVPYGQSCASSQQTRTCSNGTLSGSSAYAYSSCYTQSPASCNLNGQIIPDGSSVIRYQSATVPFGQTCQSQTRVCSNGNLSGSYTASACSVSSPASCTTAWGSVVPSGTMITGYSTSQVPYPQTCDSVRTQATCSNGIWTGPVAAQTCTTSQPASCTFNGQTVAHGSTVMAYQSSTVAFGSTCAGEARLCNNGTLSGSYSAPSCTVSAPTQCDPYVTYPSCFVGLRCQSGALLINYGTTRGVKANFNITAAIGGTVNVQTSNVTILEPGIKLTYWRNSFAAQCQPNGSWKQVADGYCTVEQTVPDSYDPACTAVPDNSGGG